MKPTSSEKNTAYDTMIAHLPEAKKAIIDVLTQLPDRYDLKFPEGPLSTQAGAIADFLVKRFKTITPNQIFEAFEANAAHQFPKHVEFYGKINLQSIGSLLHNFRQYQMSLQTRGTQGQMSPDVNIEFELFSDLRNIKQSGDGWNLTKYIDEKFAWLTKNRKDFDGTIDEKEVKKERDNYEERRAKSKNSIIPEKYINSQVMAEQEYKMKKIRVYLDGLAKYIKK